MKKVRRPDVRFARRLSFTVTLALAIAAPLMPLTSAQAQNLVPDPYFTNGVPANNSQDAAGDVFFNNAMAATLNGITGILLSGSQNASLNGSQTGFFAIAHLANYDGSGVNYIFSFLAAAIDPSINTSVAAQFGNANCGVGGCNVQQTLTSSVLTKVSLSGTSTPNGSSLFVTDTGLGDVFVTNLDLEPAPTPAPVPMPGTGLWSICAALAGFAIHKLRRQRAI